MLIEQWPWIRWKPAPDKLYGRGPVRLPGDGITRDELIAMRMTELATSIDITVRKLQWETYKSTKQTA